MSKVSKVENMLFEYFADGEVHTFEEYIQMAIKLNIISEDDSSTVRNTIYKLRTNPYFKRIEKGKYMILTQEKKNDNSLTVEDAFVFLSKRLKKIVKMNVISNSSEELEIGKREVEIYNRYVSEFSRYLGKT